jgi:ketosteroid isomerase-like protein
LTHYNEQLGKQLESQQAQLALIEQQLLELDATATAVASQVQRMFEAIEKFIASDLPFLDPTQAGPDSRSERMNRIRDMMSTEGVPVGEKYRRLMEAYQIELEYGRNMFSYKGKLEDGRDADFLRLGRVTLVYRTEDGEESGYWDAEQKAWVVNNDLVKTIERAVQVATKEIAPDLVFLPVPAPREVPLR